MCTECCWCLCIHQVSYRGASYFFCSVHNYDTVFKLLSLVAKNILLRAYFMDTSLSQELTANDPVEDVSDIVCKFSYYVSSLVTALMIFRGIEKEWRQIIEWAAAVFLIIESVAFGIQSTLYPDSFTTLPFTLTIVGRLMFVSFYLITLAMYIREMRRDEKESDLERQWKVEPSLSYIYTRNNGSSGTWNHGSLSLIGTSWTGTMNDTSLPKFKVGGGHQCVNNNDGWSKKPNKFYFPNWNWNKQESGFYFERFPKV